MSYILAAYDSQAIGLIHLKSYPLCAVQQS